MLRPLGFDVLYCVATEVLLETSILEFDPDYELNKNMRPVSNKTSDNQIVYLVIAIELEVKYERLFFVFCHRTARL